MRYVFGMWNHRLVILTFAGCLVGLASPSLGARPPTTFEGDFVVPVEAKDLEKFCRRHDGISGDLVLDRSYAHTDLSPLSCIRRVEGRLVIKNTPSLETLTGLKLDRMDEVPLRSIRIVGNEKLVDVASLVGGTASLRTANLVIQGNASLQDASGLPQVVSGANVTISDNPELATLTGPSGVRRTTRLGEVTITHNARLETISGFERVVEAGQVIIRENARMRSLGGFPVLTEVGTWSLADQPMLVDWKAGAGLSGVGRFEVHQCDGLEGLPSMPDLNRASSVSIVDNALLSSVSGLTVSRNGHPTVDELTVEGNPHLAPAELARLQERLHLPVSRDLVRISRNGTASASPPPSSTSAPAEPESTGTVQGAAGATGD